MINFIHATIVVSSVGLLLGITTIIFGGGYPYIVLIVFAILFFFGATTNKVIDLWFDPYMKAEREERSQHVDQ